MRHTFTLVIEFGGDVRGRNKRFITDRVKQLAGEQDMHAFGYEGGTLAFFARPDLVDERKDQYEVGAFRQVLGRWLERFQQTNDDVVGFEFGAVADMDAITPRVGRSRVGRSTAGDRTSITKPTTIPLNNSKS